MVEIVELAEDGAALKERITTVLGAHAAQAGHPFDATPTHLEARVAGDFAGGLQGYRLYGWGYVEFLAVSAEHRGRGVGTALLAAFEARMRSAATEGIFLDTFGYQALPFYLGHEFEEMGRLPGAVPDLDRIYLSKRFTAGASGRRRART